MSDSNDFTIIGLSKVNSSIVGPDVFPTKSFSFVISEVKQLFTFFGKVFIDENTLGGRFSSISIFYFLPFFINIVSGFSRDKSGIIIWISASEISNERIRQVLT